MRLACTLIILLAMQFLLALPAMAQSEPLAPAALEAGVDDPLDTGLAPGTNVPLEHGNAPRALFEPGSDASRVALANYVDGVIAGLQREHGLAAVTVSVVANDETWLARGYGQSDLASSRPVQADTSLFRIGSTAKTFIWTAAMMLVERGQLDLDADVNQYLADVQVDAAFGEPVSMRHLLHHRAGFEDTVRLFAVADDDPRPLSELLAAHQPRRVYPPGLRTSYSNWGSALAAQVVADIAAEPYGDFLRREILEPLRMSDTTWTAPSQLDPARRARLATGYKREDGALAVQDYMQIGAYWPAGGIASSATDMARWMRLHLNGGELDGVRLMQPETHALMWTRGFNDRPLAADVAHGFQDRHYRGLRVLGHGGGTAAFLTNMVLVPELGIGVFVSQNSTHSNAAIAQLADHVVDHLLDAGHQAAPWVEPGDPGLLSDVSGTYLQNRRVFSSFAAVFGVTSTATVTALTADVLRVSAGGTTTQYRRVADQHEAFEAADGNRIAFLRDGEGRVVAMADSSGVHTLEKVGPWGSPQTLLITSGLALLLAITTLLGFWWRIGRSYRQRAGAMLAAAIGLLSALGVLVFVLALGLLVAELSRFDLGKMAGNYPTRSMLHAHYAGWMVAVSGAAMLVVLLPTWLGSGWSLWRRVHFSLFALVLALLAVLLWQWRVIGAPVL
jgi:CubicO group peptidase (beta-lactamase class C family)